MRVEPGAPRRSVRTHQGWGWAGLIHGILQIVRPQRATRCAVWWDDTVTEHISSQDFLDAVALDGPFKEWADVYAATADPRHSTPEYAAQLEQVRASTGYIESVRVGEASLDGVRVAVIASDFAFLGGSIGERAALIIAAATRKATELGLPLVASPVSGGTRMQEGAAAFLQLATIGLALTAHRDAGLPYLVYLRSPTTGGVMASWGSLGQVSIAQPEAFLAFLGPRVVEAITGSEIPSGVQRAEHLAGTGVVDRVEDLAAFVGSFRTVLAILRVSDSIESAPHTQPPVNEAVDAWDAVTATRATNYPDILGFVRQVAPRHLELVGPHSSMADGAGYVALARLAGRGVTIVGFRGAEGAPYVSAADLARVRLAVETSGALGLPVVAVIDLQGGELTAAAEEAGIAREIARSLAAFASARVPTVAVLLGKGSGGAAFAIGATDAVVALPHAWLAPLQPEGASAIVYRDALHAAELARSQGITATDLAGAGYVDEIVPDLTALEAAIARHLDGLTALTLEERATARVARYLPLGT